MPAELIPVNLDTRERIEAIVRQIGGKPGVWLDDDKADSGSPFLWYESGWDAMDELQDKVADLIRCSFQKFDKALVIRVTQRHYSWIAFFPWTEITGLDWQARESFEESVGKHRTKGKIFGIVREFFSSEQPEDRILMQTPEIQLQLRVPAMHRNRVQDYLRRLPSFS